MSTLHPSFITAIERASATLRDSGRPVHTETWQGIDIQGKPEAEMKEILGWDFRVPLSSTELGMYQEQIKPNLPWADDHFNERVCGYPMNPGESWKTWPWTRSASTFLDSKGRFEVNYMERIWGAKPFEDTPMERDHSTLTGIRGAKYGDLDSLIELMVREPLTRQAYLPLFWPEDTGRQGRVMCSLGYHWIMRNGLLHIHYPIRSCDFYRHFRDDIYLAVRLTIWLLHRLQQLSPVWQKVSLGYYSMWIGSLHIFVNDAKILFRR